jgi:hypothetical protein
VSGQVVPDQQHSDGREKTIQLVGGRIDIPILPAPTKGNRFRGIVNLAIIVELIAGLFV